MGDEVFEGTLTLLFTDVEGSTELTSRTGDAAGRSLLRECDNVIRNQIAEYGGREIKSLGDGFFIVFSSARRAVACAVAIQKALALPSRSSGDQLRVRIGLNSGEAIYEQGDVYGSAVNAAARIAATANGGEILVSEVVKMLAGDVPGAGFVDRGRVKLKGLDEQFRLFEVTWQDDVAAIRPFERTPFVGRVAERAQLSSFVEDLARARGGLVAIGGEPGVGKTRLTEELAEEARRRQHRVLMGRCYESDAPPFIPFVEIIESAIREIAPETFRAVLGDAAGEVAKIVPQIRSVFDDIPPPLELPPEQERRYIFNSLSEFIERAASTTPLVLILEDVHWADESTLLATEHIARRLADIPALVLATYRDTELDVARSLARTLESLLRQHNVHRVRLNRLHEDELRSMLHVMSGQDPPVSLVNAIYSETEGNPFFAEEVFRHLSEEGRLFDTGGRWRTDLEIGELEVPEGVKLVVGRRLERLSLSTRAALSIAAVTGPRFEYRVLEAVGELDPDELLDAVDEAQRARLIVPDTIEGEPAFSFAHELIRQTLLTETARPRRQRRHLAIARSLQTLYEKNLEARAADIAGHLLRAGSGADAAETARFSRLAGRRALDAAAFEEALRHYENALALHPDAESPEYARILFEHGLALRTRGGFDDALSAWRAAVAIYEAAGELESAGSICREIGMQLGWSGRGNESVEWTARGLADTDGMRTKDRADLLASAGASMSWVGQYDDALRLVDEGIALAEDVGDRQTLGRALGARALHHYFYMEFGETIADAEKAATLLREAGALWDTASFEPITMFAYNSMGKFHESERILNEMLPMSDRMGHHVGSLLARRAAAAVSRPFDPKQQELAARADIAANEENNLGWIATGYTWLGAALTWKGRWDEALDAYRTGFEIEMPGAFDGFCTSLLVTHLARLGRDEEVTSLLEQKRSVLPASDPNPTLGQLTLAEGTVEATWLVGLHDIAAPCYSLLHDLLPRGVRHRIFDFRSIQLLAALAADAAGESERSDEHFAAALAAARAASLPAEEADICLYRARSLVGRGQTGHSVAVKELVGRADVLLRSVGMERYLTLMKETLSLP